MLNRVDIFHSKKTHKQLLARQKPKEDAAASTRDSDAASVNSSECSICLMSIAVSLPFNTPRPSRSNH